MPEPARNPAKPPAETETGLAIRLDGISKSFGYRDALRGVTLEIPHGTCLAVFGPNGAGKSTLARIVATQWAPTSGRGEILGHEIGRGNLRIRARSGMVADQSFLRSE